MNTKPILFSTPMVQAIDTDVKTITRRTTGLENVNQIAENPNAPNYWIDEMGNAIKCPYGKPGDVLWVRETFTIDLFGRYVYKALTGEFDGVGRKFIYSPSIHMPKVAARTFLQIKSVRVERLHDITEADAIAEGVAKDVWLDKKNFERVLIYRDYTQKTFGCLDARSSFMTLWVSINGKESYYANPWVWVVAYEKIAKPEGFL